MTNARQVINPRARWENNELSDRHSGIRGVSISQFTETHRGTGLPTVAVRWLGGDVFAPKNNRIRVARPAAPTAITRIDHNTHLRDQSGDISRVHRKC